MMSTGLTSLHLTLSIFVVNTDAVSQQLDYIHLCLELSMGLDFLFLNTDSTVIHSRLKTGLLIVSASYLQNKQWQTWHTFWVK